MTRKKGFTLVELLVVVAIIALLVAILLPTLGRARELAKRSICAGSLNAIGKCIHVYANDYNGFIPLRDEANAPVSAVGFMRATKEPPSIASYCQSRGWYQLIKQSYVTRDAFWCASDPKVDRSTYTDDRNGPGNIWDFPIHPTSNSAYPISYAMQVTMVNLLADASAATKGVPISVSNRGDLAIMADQTPYIKWKAESGTDFSNTWVKVFTGSEQDGDPKLNSPNHDTEGQNVLYLSTSVQFTKSCLVGINRDNIWTPADRTGGNRKWGMWLNDFLSARPADKEDSFLLP